LFQTVREGKPMRDNDNIFTRHIKPAVRARQV
jgi:hypothetical protein